MSQDDELRRYTSGHPLYVLAEVPHKGSYSFVHVHEGVQKGRHGGYQGLLNFFPFVFHTSTLSFHISYNVFSISRVMGQFKRECLTSLTMEELE